MSELNTPKGVSRRTIAKGAAWTVPAIAVAGAAPAMAASPPEQPPPPNFDFATAWKNPGNSCTTTCTPMQSYGTRVFVTNPSDEDFQIQFTSYFIGTTNVGVHAISGTQTCGPLSTGCSAACAPTYNTHAVCVPAGTTSPIALYVNSAGYGSSPNESQTIGWRWVRISDCTVTASADANSPVSPPGCPSAGV